MDAPKALLELARFCDGEGSRYTLDGVKIERSADGMALAAATDGRILAVLEWSDDDKSCDGCIIPAEALTLAKHIARKTNARGIRISKDAVVVLGKFSTSEEVASVPFETLEGRWPKWLGCLHLQKNPRTCLFDPRRLIAALELACSVLDADRGVSITLDHDDPDSPITISAKSESHRAVVVVMPKRREDDKQNREPDWTGPTALAKPESQGEEV